MKTTACSDVADYVWLTGDEASAVLADLAEDAAPLHALVSRLRRSFSAERTHLLLEQIELRRRAAAKFTRAPQMFFTRVGLEQATDEWVAAYKASCFARRAGPSPASKSIADLCCGIGGDLSSLAAVGPVVGLDRDAVVAHFAAVNSGAQVVAEDIASFGVSGIDALHIDPDRRPAGERTTSLEACEPNVTTIDQLMLRVPNAAVKLAPATKVPKAWAEKCELEWISRDRECRQLVAWHGALAEVPGHRSATVLRSAGCLACSVTGLPDQPMAVVPKVDRFVFDVDAAVLAARLQGVLAAEHGLSALSTGPTYLTGPNAIDDAALACFEVADVLPMETRAMSRYLSERSIGAIEIKKRGVEVDPDELRRNLKLRGDNAVTLLVARIDGRTAAIVADRVVGEGRRSLEASPGS